MVGDAFLADQEIVFLFSKFSVYSQELLPCLTECITVRNYLCIVLSRRIYCILHSVILSNYSTWGNSVKLADL